MLLPYGTQTVDTAEEKSGGGKSRLHQKTHPDSSLWKELQMKQLVQLLQSYS